MEAVSGMQARRMRLVLLGTLVYLCPHVAGLRMKKPVGTDSAGRCVSMQEGGSLSKFASCSVVGYNNTFPFPEHVPVLRLSRLLGWMVKHYGNCSQNGITEAMLCSMFVPKCVSPSKSPLLPCRRVCSEFIKQCEVKIEQIYLDVIVGMCEILPDENATSGQCLEPPGFSFNNNIPDPLLRPCEPLIIPACQGKGYSHTMLKISAQKKLYSLLYRTNFTKESASKDFPPRVAKTIQKHSKCRENLEKHFCSSMFPPCFPPEGAAWYTLCKSACREIIDDCPDVATDRLLTFGCTNLQEGSSAHGYCKHTNWPDVRDWIPLTPMTRKAEPTTAPSSGKSGPSAGVIAAAVLVPALLVGAVIGAVFVWRKRASRWPNVRYTKQQDDMVPLET